MPTTRLTPTARRRIDRRARGSAYLLALLVLVVLSLVGLSVALITQTEQQIGATEKEAERAFYAADSALAISVVLAQDGSMESRRLALNSRTVAGVEIADRVLLSPFAVVFSGPCNLCMVNQDRDHKQVNAAVTAWESRQSRPAGLGVNDPWSHELSQSLVGVLIGLQPVESARFTPEQEHEYSQRELPSEQLSASLVRW